jgi:hypothetical protein
VTRKQVRPLSHVAFLLLVFPILAAGQDVSPSDDAFHYASWAGGQHDGNYIEWWYFNFYDTQQNLQGIFSYFITDPQNLTGFGQSQIAAVTYSANGMVSEVDTYPVTAFSASGQAANAQIATNSIQALSANTYRIVGQSRDGRLQWDLRYVSQLSPWFAANRMAVGNLSWESMSWLIYMPRAMVVGQVVIDGHAYTVNAPGYHDHNWGEWIFSNAMWNWAQYSENDFAFDLGDFIGGSAGLASVEIHGERTVFTKNQYKLIHTKWAFDAENEKWYPIESVFSAQNDGVALVLDMRVISTAPIRGHLPFPLPDVIIYEQTTAYDGLILKKTSAGQAASSSTFHGRGFKEYTAKTRTQP